jgi:Leucine-rich repeat (LRR) protein
MNILKRSIAFFIALSMVFISGNASVDDLWKDINFSNQTQSQLLDKFIECAYYCYKVSERVLNNERAEEIVVIEELSEAFVIPNDKTVLALYQMACSCDMSLLACVFANKYFESVKADYVSCADKDAFFKLPALSQDAQDLLRKIFFVKTRDSSSLTYKNNMNEAVNLTLTLKDVLRERRFWIEGGGRLRLCDLSLASMDGFNVRSGISQVYELDLSNNSLSSLPSSIAHIKTLRKLDLSHNKLTTLPDFIFDLPDLEMLVINNNQLTSLPAGISKLKKLWRLEINNNRLTSLPVEIAECSRLAIISANNNEISKFPLMLMHMPSIERIYLKNNGVTENVSLKAFKKLRFLDISN